MNKLSTAFLALGALVLSISSGLAQHEGHDQGSAHKKAPAAQQEEQIDARTVRGEIVDITCYIRHDSRGEKHIKCAEYCANLGMPLGVLEDETNKLYLIIPPGHEDPKKLVMPFLGKKVKVDAILYTMGGLTGVEIEKIEEIKQ